MFEQKPWLKYYGKDTPESIEYPRVTLYGALMKTVERLPDAVAWDFMGKLCTYRDFADEIDQCARMLAGLGLGPGDRITISMPTVPQGVICVYAANKLGAVCSMIHPLSPPKEIVFYLQASKSKMALTLDAFYPPFKEAMKEYDGLETLLLARIPDYLPGLKAIGFKLTKGRKIKPVPPDPRVRWWHEEMKISYPQVPQAGAFEDLAVIMYSGGTTGVPKGIMLSNQNLICEGMQAASWCEITDTDAMLAILPIFHGFGLGMCINAVMMGGGKSILVPQFTPDDVAKLIKNKRPTFLVGVPTLYDALNHNPVFNKADLSCIRAAFCGADTLPRKVKEEFEAIVQRQGGSVKLLEGYGLTEAVTGIMAMPLDEYREGSIGVPFPDMLAKVVKVDTQEDVPIGEEGEICLHGPSVMMGYLDNPEENAKTLQTHADGKVWLHTGDIAKADADGFFYFALRLKRMIKSSGMNVYPAQVEDILMKHDEVDTACVIGVPDEKQVERVKGFVVLKDPSQGGPDKEKQLIEHCQEHLIKWSCPREIEFREEMPKTLIGKVAFKELEQEELERLRAAGKYTGE